MSGVFTTDTGKVIVSETKREVVQIVTAGPVGKSDYQLAREAGFTGTLTEWLASLKGKDGVSTPLTATFAFTGDLALSTGEVRWYSPRAAHITQIEAWLAVATSGAPLTVVLKKNGAAMHTLTIPAGANAITPLAVDYPLLSTDYLTADITSIGAGPAGKHLSIRITLT